MAEKPIEVTFPSGRDVLRAYWGFLSNGGLVIPGAKGLEEGQAVALRVIIESAQREFALRGLVVNRPELPSLGPDRAVIEFKPGEPHDLLLSAAWADTDNVPARRHRRMPASRDLRVRRDGSTLVARLLNVSLGGCCLAMGASAQLAPGEKVEVVAPEHSASASAVVRWCRAADVGVEFEGDDDSVMAFARLFV